jgi:hypothetical protein
MVSEIAIAIASEGFDRCVEEIFVSIDLNK